MAAVQKPWRRKFGRRGKAVVVSLRGILIVLCVCCSLVVWRALVPLHYPRRHSCNLWIVAQSGPGRLGNQMFQFASALGVYHQRLRTAPLFNDTVNFCIDPKHSFDDPLRSVGDQLIPSFPKFSSVFDGPFLPCPDEILALLRNIPERGYGRYEAFDTDDCPMDSPCVRSLGIYLQSFRYLEHADREIRSAFSFRESIQQRVVSFLNRVAPKTADFGKRTLVGVHVRRGDVLKAEYLREAPESFFAKAMQYYRDKYPNVLFLVATDDEWWCVQQPAFQGNDVVFLQPSYDEPAVDMAILTQCDHVIMSVGTFGWWAGWLAGGEVVYYKDAIVLSHENNRGQVDLKDHYPPNWIGISG